MDENDRLILTMAQNVASIKTQLDTMFPNGCPPCGIHAERLKSLEKWKTRIVAGLVALTGTSAGIFLKELIDNA